MEDQIFMQNKKRISNLLIKWFKNNGRTYPWREKRNPYEILIAEIMLQRTKADQVTPVFLSFLDEFPDLETLSNAPSEKITKYFSKLGLIHRAERVKTLATELNKRFNGNIPNKRKELLSLPSVGEYITNAVLCFAFGEQVAVIDSNVCRILGRLFTLNANGEARRDPQFKYAINELLPSGSAKEFNWGMIDLGALVCKPTKPLCHKCPLREFCDYSSANLTNNRTA